MTPDRPESPRTHKHGSGQMAFYCFLGSERVVVVVGNYKFATFIYEIGHHLGMLPTLMDPRRIQNAPKLLVLLKNGGHVTPIWRRVKEFKWG